jgi:hypothetical protein
MMISPTTISTKKKKKKKLQLHQLHPKKLNPSAKKIYTKCQNKKEKKKDLVES